MEPRLPGIGRAATPPRTAPRPARSRLRAAPRLPGAQLRPGAAPGVAQRLVEGPRLLVERRGPRHIALLVRGAPEAAQRVSYAALVAHAARERQALLIQAHARLQVALVGCRGVQAFEREHRLAMTAHGPAQRQALFQQRAGFREVGLAQGQRAGRAQGLGPGRGRRRRARCRARPPAIAGPRTSGRASTRSAPARPSRRAAVSPSLLASAQFPARRAGYHVPAPAASHSAWAGPFKAGSACSAKSEVAARGARALRACSPGPEQLFAGVFADGFQHAIARLRATQIDLHERLVHQPAQQVNQGRRLAAARPAHRFSGFEAPAAREDTPAPAAAALAAAEQVIAPVQRSAQGRAAASGRAHGQQPEARVEAVGDLRERQIADTRRRTLDREGHAVEARQIQRDGRGIVRGEMEPGSPPPRGPGTAARPAPRRCCSARPNSGSGRSSGGTSMIRRPGCRGLPGS